MLIVLIVVVGSVVVFGLTYHGLGALARRGKRNPSRTGVLWWFAVVTGAALIALYAWGMLAVGFAVLDAEDGGVDSSPFRPCRTPGWEGRDIVAYKADFLPVRFVCETSDGGSYVTESVPDYVNPGLLGLALATAGFGVSATLGSKSRARSTSTEENARPQAL